MVDMQPAPHTTITSASIQLPPSTPTPCSSIVLMEGKFMGIPTKKQRQWTLMYKSLTINSVSRGPFSFPRTVRVKQGGVWEEKENGLQVETDQGEWLHAVTATKLQWAMWLQALQNLSSPKRRAARRSSRRSNSRHLLRPMSQPPVSRPPKKAVKFEPRVRVRKIPPVAPEDMDALYYTSKEIGDMTDTAEADAMTGVECPISHRNAAVMV
ncbi:Aste57867_2658 [Aphanomyces stellatus]|uniref:Aste57867_2658 protein n=1 Tax=Aphanomyces stellatus TaxID=120398 RepID=A0A485KDQ8_9STRA|nr:hypothetical protein As57867_002651 [Aphanomyces stellatus]VFT79852.1 Aste57867_2658 [Aphanomyces stellatus]